MNLRRHLTILKVLAASKPSHRRQLLSELDCRDIQALSEICLNLLKGNIPLTPALYDSLKKHKRTIRYIANKSQHKCVNRLRRYITNQRGGLFPILPLILPAVASLVASVSGRAISKALGH